MVKCRLWEAVVVGSSGDASLVDVVVKIGKVYLFLTCT